MIKKIRFTTTECGRCSGTGRYGPMSVAGGQCMGCKGGGIVLTRAGKTARAAYDVAMDEALNTALEDVTPGDLVWSAAHKEIDGRYAEYGYRWRVVKTLEATESKVYRTLPDGTLQGRTDYVVTFDDGKWATFVGKGDVGSSGVALRVYDENAIQRVFADVVDRFQGAKAAAR